MMVENRYVHFKDVPKNYILNIVSSTFKLCHLSTLLNCGPFAAVANTESVASQETQEPTNNEIIDKVTVAVG